MFSINLNKALLLSILILINFSFAESNHDSNEQQEEHAHDNEKGHDEHNEHSEEGRQDVVQLSEAELREFGVQLEVAQAGEIEKQIQLTGEIATNEENVAHISARFEGIIKNVYVKLGQYIQVGKVLAVVENSSNLTSYNIKAKRSGVITFKDAALGEIVEPGGNLFRISNLNTVWVNLSVYQKDLSKIKMGMKLKIQDPYSQAEIASKISYTSPVMNEQTRTVNIRATIPSQKGTWKPGMFINGFLSTSSQEVKLRVPQSAIHNYEGKTVVFVKDDDGFEPKTITLGVSNDSYAEVLTGIHKGDIFADKNSFIIKSELGKSEMSSGHNH